MLSQCWKVLDVGTFKITADVDLNNCQKVSDDGVIIRDCNGYVMASLCHYFEPCCQPQIAEAMAILRGLRFALETGLVPTSLESDALAVVNMIGSKSVHCSDVGGGYS
ncbi:hypothetical protein Dsin_008739 [Dipteronia sinensis]|uniref:RNase H type-1 domain-containing protein n=1 Tax=Dipteronia sinensis TaxID=43782 RepID=A0AAE0AQE0_9ROSI|nr:hypothetical protein Dsin_008739 [Dipteronia sinensis]